MDLEVSEDLGDSWDGGLEDLEYLEGLDDLVEDCEDLEDFRSCELSRILSGNIGRIRGFGYV